MYIRIGTCISFFSLSQSHLFVICLRYVRWCMKDWYLFIFILLFFILLFIYFIFFIYLFYFIFLIHVVLGLSACPCEFLYMYVSVVSEGLMED